LASLIGKQNLNSTVSEPVLLQPEDLEQVVHSPSLKFEHMSAVIDPVVNFLERHGGKFENFVIDGIRGPSFRSRLFEAFLVQLSVVAACMPLIVAGITSYVEAQEICFERHSHIPARTDHQKARRDDKGDLDFLYPGFYWMMVAAIISLVCLLLWLEKSPHKSSQHAKGKKLDTMLGSFCLLQYTGCVLTILFWEPSICTENVIVEKLFNTLTLVATAGTSGTRLQFVLYVQRLC
jgi:hypothetical protein